MNTSQLTIPTKKSRHFLPNDLVIDAWEVLEPYFKDLLGRNIDSVEELDAWLMDRSELDAVLEEDAAWRYIKMTIDTTDESLVESYNFFVSRIQPMISPYNNEFHKKMMDSPYLKDLDQEKYAIYLRGVKQELEIYRDENVELLAEIAKESQKFGAISGAMTIEYKGEEMTMQKANTFLKSTDRKEREEVFRLAAERRIQDSEKLDDLFNKLVQLRNTVAKNAGFDNYRDYMFSALGRFDYTPQDCFDFHEGIASEILPIVKQFQEERKAALHLDVLRPWDTDVDITGKPPLKPFETGAELIDKSIETFNKVAPYFGECLAVMREMGYLDLESKNGKAPGGYNYPLYEIGVPFIFMNAVGSHTDLITMMHEGGHAIHSFLTRNLDFTAFKSLPSEVAELASMSMELISMDHWDVFLSNEEELRRAKREQLEKILSILPWIATIDRFQHWLYENPTHTVEERTAAWLEIRNFLGTNLVDWSEHERALETGWQRQMHLYEVPFYYIEYAMAQLGAIAIWRNYKQNPEKALLQYTAALKLGYTKSIGEIYETAGIEFNFSQAYIRELADFIKGELQKI